MYTRWDIFLDGAGNKTKLSTPLVLINLMRSTRVAQKGHETVVAMLFWIVLQLCHSPT